MTNRIAKQGVLFFLLIPTTLGSATMNPSGAVTVPTDAPAVLEGMPNQV